MFINKAPAEKTGLEEARDTLLLELKSFSADDEEFAKMMVHLKTLTELIDLEKSESLNPNTVALVIGNAIVAILVIGYESKNVVTSKVLNFMLKLK